MEEQVGDSGQASVCLGTWQHLLSPACAPSPAQPRQGGTPALRDEHPPQDSLGSGHQSQGSASCWVFSKARGPGCFSQALSWCVGSAVEGWPNPWRSSSISLELPGRLQVWIYSTLKHRGGLREG